MVTPGIRPPEGSRTRPMMVVCRPCAASDAAVRDTRKADSKHVTQRGRCDERRRCWDSIGQNSTNESREISRLIREVMPRLDECKVKNFRFEIFLEVR